MVLLLLLVAVDITGRLSILTLHPGQERIRQDIDV
jgi:hypothetical protein